MRLNLNADLGESWGAFTMGDDSSLLGVVNSANLACGMHGGDPLVMSRTIAAAKAKRVSIGAHPGYADLQGFGRRPMHLSAEELTALVIYQIGALQALADAQGWPVTHVKLHGAMSNQACADQDMAGVIVRAIRAVSPDLVLLAPALSQLARAGDEAGLPVRIEVFADRAYQEDGQLVPRSQPGAVLHGAEVCRDHVLHMVDAGGLVTTTGRVLPVGFDSVCLHGDGADAVAAAIAVRDGLLSMGHDLVPLTAL